MSLLQWQRYFLRNPRRLITLLLVGGLQITVFLLGRFSSQLSSVERVPLTQRVHGEASQQSPPLKTYLLILIMTRPNETRVRDAVKETWLRLSSKTPQQFRYAFPVGTKGLSSTQMAELKTEAELPAANLLLLPNLTDSYERLAVKTAISLQLAVELYDFRFLLKVDADSFVRLGALLKSLRDIEHPRLYWGFLDGRARPFRRGKWKESGWILCDRYLPYQLGAGYVISRQLTEFIASNVKLLKYYRSEDVSVGAWLAGLDVRYVHDPRFDTEFTSRGCHNDYLVTHKSGAGSLQELFENVRSGRELCGAKGEYRLHGSYVYDFAALPSRCCERRNDSKIP